MNVFERILQALAMSALAALPFESDQLAVSLGPVRVTIPEALVGATIAAGLAWAIVGPGAAALRRVAPFAAAAGLFVSALAVSAIAAPEHRDLAFKFVCRIAGGAAFGTVVAALVATRTRAAANLMTAFAAGVLVSSVIAVAEFAWPDVVVPHLWLFRTSAIYSAGSVRAASTYGYPNTLATSIAMAFPVVVARMSAAIGRRWIGAVALCVLCVALVTTFSRGGLVAAVAGLGVVSIVAWSLTERRLAVQAAGTVALIAMTWLAAWLGAAQLARRGTVADQRQLLSASIQPAVRAIAVRPGAEATMPISVTNTGALAWTSTDAAPFTLVSRWYDTAGSEVTVEGDRTFLPRDVAPGESLALNGVYVAPPAEGDYWLVWDVYVENRVRFGELGSRISAVRVASRQDPRIADAVVQRWLGGDAASPSLSTDPGRQAYVPPGRRSLWWAALAMFRERPLVGIGPDNYRLSYGRFLGLDAWDMRVYANNMYLELLATSGLLGFCAFLVLLAVVARHTLNVLRENRTRGAGDAMAIAACASLAALLVHGLVDYFLEFTAGYIALFTWMGILAGFGAAADADITRPKAGSAA